jgi:hypothetical protein
MGEDNKEIIPRLNAPDDSTVGACCGGGKYHPPPCQHWNQRNQSGKFKGKTKEIEFNTFDNTGPHDAAQLNKSLKNIADHLQCIHGNAVSKAVCNMTPVKIDIPPAPQGKSSGSTILLVTEVKLYLWKRGHAKAQDRKDKYNKNMTKAYIIIYHQCSPNLKNDLKASNTFTNICSNQDLIGLLKLVQSLCCSYDANTQGVMATVASHKRLFTHYQKDTGNNHTYHREFLAHTKTIETYVSIRVVGVVPTFLATKIKELADARTITDADNLTDAERAIALAAVHEENLAALMLSSAHREQFGDLQMDLKNQYGYGDDRYPKTLNACLSLHNMWMTSTHHKTPCTPKGTPPFTEQAKEEKHWFLLKTQRNHSPAPQLATTYP